MNDRGDAHWAHLPLFLSESMSRSQARARQWCKFMALGPRATGTESVAMAAVAIVGGFMGTNFATSIVQLYFKRPPYLLLHCTLLKFLASSPICIVVKSATE